MNIYEPLGEFNEPTPELHSNFSIKYGYLLMQGQITWGTNGWDWQAYSDEQKDRIIEQMARRFFDLEINYFPIGLWKRNFIQVLTETQAKYNSWYDAIEEGFSPFYSNREWEKNRDVESNFPQVRLSRNPNFDYASSGTDRERELVRFGDGLEIAEGFKTFKAVDTAFLEEVENQCFTALVTVKMNAIY